MAYFVFGTPVYQLWHFYAFATQPIFIFVIGQKLNNNVAI